MMSVLIQWDKTDKIRQHILHKWKGENDFAYGVTWEKNTMTPYACMNAKAGMDGNKIIKGQIWVGIVQESKGFKLVVEIIWAIGNSVNKATSARKE